MILLPHRALAGILLALSAATAPAQPPVVAGAAPAEICAYTTSPAGKAACLCFHEKLAPFVDPSLLALHGRIAKDSAPLRDLAATGKGSPELSARATDLATAYARQRVTPEQEIAVALARFACILDQHPDKVGAQLWPGAAIGPGRTDKADLDREIARLKPLLAGHAGAWAVAKDAPRAELSADGTFRVFGPPGGPAVPAMKTALAAAPLFVAWRGRPDSGAAITRVGESWVLTRTFVAHQLAHNEGFKDRKEDWRPDLIDPGDGKPVPKVVEVAIETPLEAPEDARLHLRLVNWKERTMECWNAPFCGMSRQR